MDISVRRDQILTENRSWLGSQHGTQATRTVTLDLSTFTQATHYPQGTVPSGVLLGKIDASNLFGPYDPAATDGRQNPAGHLFNTTAVPSGTARVGAPLLEHGAVVESKLPANHGLDASAKTALGGRIIYR